MSGLFNSGNQFLNLFNKGTFISKGYLNGNLIYNGDLCVSPGNVGLTAIHSLTFGTPVLTHDYFPYQMPEFEAIHEGQTGSFFKYGNIQSLAEKINQWFDIPVSRETIRKLCMCEIDYFWNPSFQINVLKKNL